MQLFKKSAPPQTVWHAAKNNHLGLPPPPQLRARVKGTNPAMKKSSNIPKIYAEMFGRFY